MSPPSSAATGGQRLERNGRPRRATLRLYSEGSAVIVIRVLRAQHDLRTSRGSRRCLRTAPTRSRPRDHRVPPVKCCSPCVEMSMNVVRSVVPESCHPHVSVPQFVSTQPTKVSLPLPTISPETALTARSSVKVPVPEMSPVHVSVTPSQCTRNICPVCTNAPQVPSDPGG